MFRGRSRGRRALGGLLSSVYSTYALALPFKTSGTDGFWVGGTQYGLVPGPELVVNGGGASTAGWSGYSSGSIAASGGLFTITVPGFSAGARQDFATVVGVPYSVSCDLSTFSGTNGRIALFDSGLSTNYASSSYDSVAGTKTLTFVPTTTTTTVLLQGDGVGTFKADNISIKRQSGVNNLPGYSYTRSGQVGFVNQAGGVDYFAVAEPPIEAGIGYEAYGALTNLALQSQAFDSASWTKTNVTVTANTTVAPDGTTTMDSLLETAVVGNHNLEQGFINVTLGQTLTYAVIAKDNGRIFQIAFQVGFGNKRANFNLAAGTVGTFDTTTANIIPLANGMYLCTATATATATAVATINILTVTTAASVFAESFLGDTTKGAFIWQAQFILGNFPDGGPIIATSAASASVGESLLKSTITAPVEGDALYYAIGAIKTAGINQFFFELNDGVNSNRLLLYMNSGFGAQVIVGGTATYNLISGTPVVGQTVTMVLRRLAGAWRGGYIIAGVITWLSIDTTTTFPAGMVNVTNGNTFGGGQPFNGISSGAFIKAGTFSTDAAVIAATF